MTNGHRRIFAGTELAARIERAERSLIAESALAAGRRDPGGRCFATTLASGVAARAGEGSPLNKVAGLGFDGPLDEGELDAIERAYGTALASAEFKAEACGLSLRTYRAQNR